MATSDPSSEWNEDGNIPNASKFVCGREGKRESAVSMSGQADYKYGLDDCLRWSNTTWQYHFEPAAFTPVGFLVIKELSSPVDWIPRLFDGVLTVEEEADIPVGWFVWDRALSMVGFFLDQEMAQTACDQLNEEKAEKGWVFTVKHVTEEKQTGPTPYNPKSFSAPLFSSVKDAM